MPVEKYSVSFQSRIAGQITARQVGGFDRSSTIGTALERYFAILERSRVRLREQLTDQEMGVILDVLNGTVFDGPLAIQAVSLEISDSLPDGYAQKWEVDGPALVDKLQKLSYAETAALVDAVERWWNRVAAGEQPQPGEALKK